MSQLENRVGKLEQRAGVGENDWPVIRYMCHQGGGEEEAAKARSRGRRSVGGRKRVAGGS